MRNAITVTMDPAGRLVIPKAIREAAELRAGAPLLIEVVEGRIEIVPEPRKVRIERQGRLSVAVAAAPSEPLREATVRKTLEGIRAGRGSSR